MMQLIAESLTARRFSTLLLSTFAMVALILSLAGIYAVISHAVAQRTFEIERISPSLVSTPATSKVEPAARIVN